MSDLIDRARKLAIAATGGSTTTSGAPPPPSTSGGSSGISYQTYTAPNGPQGSALPAGTIYTMGSNGSLSIDYRPSTSGGGSGAVSVSLNPNSTAAWGRATDQAGNVWMVNELDPSQNYILFPAPSGGSGNPRESYPGSGITPEGVSVYAIPSSQSPTGYMLADGTAVYPNGAPFGGNVFDQAQRGTGIQYTKNDGTKAIFYPGTGEVVDLPGTGGQAPPMSGPVGGGGGGSSSAYSGIATQMLANSGALQRIEAESAATMARDAAQAALQREMINLQQSFTAEQNALDR